MVLFLNFSWIAFREIERVQQDPPICLDYILVESTGWGWFQRLALVKWVNQWGIQLPGITCIVLGVILVSWLVNPYGTYVTILCPLGKSVGYSTPWDNLHGTGRYSSQLVG